MFETLELDTDARGIATLWLNRPEKRNALSGQMIEELTAAVSEISRNGEEATERGFVRVAEEYNGYVIMGWKTEFDLRDQGPEWERYREPAYLAFGDNSRNSEDSRTWGPVPEQNLVGPAFVVYWPFTDHWGSIN